MFTDNKYVVEIKNMKTDFHEEITENRNMLF